VRARKGARRGGSDTRACRGQFHTDAFL